MKKDKFNLGSFPIYLNIGSIKEMFSINKNVPNINNKKNIEIKSWLKQAIIKIHKKTKYHTNEIISWAVRL